MTFNDPNLCPSVVKIKWALIRWAEKATMAKKGHEGKRRRRRKRRPKALLKVKGSVGRRVQCLNVL